ncbi:MAG: biotin transporter BioY [Brevundimonas sp.]|nr:MAG: biotin transporter BioY [Brevundimonas sp.]
MGRIAPAVLVPAFTALMALGARLEVPMVPVPMTMQTFAVLLAGAALGPVWGTASVLLYLALALLGLPLLADGAAGLGPFSGPTAGYLATFPVAAALAGLAGVRGGLDGTWRATGLLFGLHLMILTLGGLWLAKSLGLSAAIASGFAPFLVGAGAKSLLAALAAPPLRSRLSAN